MSYRHIPPMPTMHTHVGRILLAFAREPKIETLIDFIEGAGGKDYENKTDSIAVHIGNELAQMYNDMQSLIQELAADRKSSDDLCNELRRQVERQNYALAKARTLLSSKDPKKVSKALAVLNS